MTEYIHVKSIGNPEECQTAMKNIGDMLFQMWKDLKLKNYCDLIYPRIEDINSSLKDTNYKTITKERFPFLLVIITKNSDAEIDFEELTKNLGLERITTTSSL